MSCPREIFELRRFIKESGYNKELNANGRRIFSDNDEAKYVNPL
jgi:hypothetical protein